MEEKKIRGMKEIKKINVKASNGLAEIKTEIVLSSDEFVITSDAADSVNESSASILA